MLDKDFNNTFVVVVDRNEERSVVVNIFGFDVCAVN